MVFELWTELLKRGEVCNEAQGKTDVVYKYFRFRKSVVGTMDK